MTDLNSLLPANSGWVLESAQFINNSGRIVGTGTYNDQSQWAHLRSRRSKSSARGQRRRGSIRRL